MMRRPLGTASLLVMLLAACGGGGGGEGGGGQPETSKPPCSSPPASVGYTRTVLPMNFPTPDGLTYTGSSKAGPSTLVQAYFVGDLDAAYQRYLDDFHSTGYTVTGSEKEADDAEVNFSGGNTTGQVKLKAECEGRVSVDITIRPD